MLLRDMVPDGHIPGMLVDPAWYEPKHPLEKIKTKSDPIAVRKPAPDKSPSGYTLQVPFYDIPSDDTIARFSFFIGNGSPLLS